MTKYFFSKCFAVLKQKPMLMWGLSLLSVLLCGLASVFGVLPIISVPIAFVLTAGMAKVYLDGYNGKKISSDQLFEGFKNFLHVAGGMAWMSLWVFLWSLIPVVGIVFGIIKMYSYRFTPYILMTEPDISATEALRESMKRTEGHKGKMFVCDLLAGLSIFGVYAVFGLLSMIPYIGALFAIILGLFGIAVSIYAPLFFGILGACYFEEIPKLPKIPMYQYPVQGYPVQGVPYQQPVMPNQPPYQPYQPVQPQPAPQPSAEPAAPKSAVCPSCGAPIGDGQKFCSVCGGKL